VFLEGTQPVDSAPAPGGRTPTDFALDEAEWVAGGT
jgi:hypothetical protein